MSNDNEREYFRRREAQEREAATKADNAVRKLHSNMADKYAQMADGDETGDQRTANDE